MRSLRYDIRLAGPKSVKRECELVVCVCTYRRVKVHGYLLLPGVCVTDWQKVILAKKNRNLKVIYNRRTQTYKNTWKSVTIVDSSSYVVYS